MIDINALIDRLRTRSIERPDLDCDPDADIEWAESLGPPRSADDFALTIVFVICNSGMRYTVARGIYDRVRDALYAGKSASTAFGHAGKTEAIDQIWFERISLYLLYMGREDGRLEFIERLPWIGKITKYHVAKNFGLPYAKPDVHMDRLATAFKTTAQALCEAIASTSGYRVATIDTLLWRAAAVGVLDTSTGKLK